MGAKLGARGGCTAGTGRSGLEGAVPTPMLASGRWSTDEVPGTVLISFHVLGTDSKHTIIYDEFYRGRTEH